MYLRQLLLDEANKTIANFMNAQQTKETTRNAGREEGRSAGRGAGRGGRDKSQYQSSNILEEKGHPSEIHLLREKIETQDEKFAEMFEMIKSLQHNDQRHNATSHNQIHQQQQEQYYSPNSYQTPSPLAKRTDVKRTPEGMGSGYLTQPMDSTNDPD
jgi:hypothetical protein